MELVNNSFKLRLFIGGLLIFAALIILPLIFALFSSQSGSLHVEAADVNTSFTSEDSGNPNVIADGMGTMFNGLARSAAAAEKSMASGVNVTADNLAKGSSALIKTGASGVKFAANGVLKSATFTVRFVGNSVLFIVRVPGKLISSIGKVPSLRSIIRPSENTKVPVIDSQLSALYSAHPTPAPKSPTQSIAPQTSQNTAWPIHGQVTTQFGVPHRPYQVTHTGLDISSGQRAGITAIHPFKSGTVIGIVRSTQGLGNHLIIDHGGGLTSVYGHMYSIAVSVGQQVDNNTILGYEGSTGASTGPHLHFEIRINGQPVNPRQFINGNPNNA